MNNYLVYDDCCSFCTMIATKLKVVIKDTDFIIWPKSDFDSIKDKLILCPSEIGDIERDVHFFKFISLKHVVYSKGQAVAQVLSLKLKFLDKFSQTYIGKKVFDTLYFVLKKIRRIYNNYCSK